MPDSFGTDKALLERVAALEANRENDVRRIGGLEYKIDRLLWVAFAILGTNLLGLFTRSAS